MNLKKPLLGIILTGTTLFGQNADPLSTPNGPNAPQVGTIVPETIGFAMPLAPAADFLALARNDSFLLSGLENRFYADFPNEVVITLYHTPW